MNLKISEITSKPRHSHPKRLTSWTTIGLEFMALFAISAYYAYQSFDEAQRSLDWLAVNAKLGKAWTYQETGRNSGHQTELHCPYTFHVGPNEYSGQLPMLKFARPQDAEAALAGFPEGKLETIFYNPTNPNESLVLKGAAGEQSSFLLKVSLAGFILSLTVFICSFIWRKRR
jgi:hypothetical protein